MSLTRHIEPEDLALFAMQLLGKDEARAVAAHVEECPDCRHLLAEVQGDLAVYAHAVDMHSPPALARERLMKQVAREKKVVPIERAPVQAPLPTRSEQVFRTGLGSGAYLADEEPKRSTLSKLAPWAGWAAAAGLAVTAWSFYNDRDVLQGRLKSQASQMDRISADAAAAKQMLDAMTDPTAKHVTLMKAPASPTTPDPQGRATYVSEKGALIFLASNMEPLQPYKVYELWLIPADGRDPIPAGTFRPDEHGNASVIMPPLPKGIEARAFGVTIEDEGGSQTPTLPIILAGN
ncbi:MAG TPA: anti-sigma factor [Edaphobacter sp.]|nr:anti-sigma factor [Edaphobacter sp.]